MTISKYFKYIAFVWVNDYTMKKSMEKTFQIIQMLYKQFKVFLLVFYYSFLSPNPMSYNNFKKTYKKKNDYLTNI